MSDNLCLHALPWNTCITCMGSPREELERLRADVARLTAERDAANALASRLAKACVVHESWNGVTRCVACGTYTYGAPLEHKDGCDAREP